MRPQKDVDDVQPHKKYSTKSDLNHHLWTGSYHCMDTFSVQIQLEQTHNS